MSSAKNMQHVGVCDFCGTECYLKDLTENDGYHRCPDCEAQYQELLKEEPDVCPHCDGVGLGAYEGTLCWRCLGKE